MLLLLSDGNDTYEDKMTLITEADSTYGQSDLRDIKFGTYSLQLTFNDAQDTSVPVGTCLQESVTLDKTGSTLVCDMTLRRRAIAGGHLLATMGINVFDTNNEPIPGAKVYVNESFVGLTNAGEFGTNGYLKTYVVAGDVLFRAEGATNGGEVNSSLSPLEITNVDIVLDSPLSEPSHSVTIVDIDAEVSGWVNFNGETNGEDADTTNFISGNFESNGLQHCNFFVFDLSGVEGQVRSATLKLENPDDGFYSFDNDYFNKSDYYTYYIMGINERESHIKSSDMLPQNWSYPYTGIAAWSIISNGTPKIYGDVQVNETTNGTIVEINFNSEGIADLNSFLESENSDGYYTLGGNIIKPNVRELHIFSNTGYNKYSRQLSLEMYEPVVSED